MEDLRQMLELNMQKEPLLRLAMDSEVKFVLSVLTEELNMEARGSNGWVAEAPLMDILGLRCSSCLLGLFSVTEMGFEMDFWMGVHSIWNEASLLFIANG